MAGVPDWIRDHWQPIIAGWGAVLSTVLAARTWWRERSRIHFWVGVGRGGIDDRGNVLLVRGALGPGYGLEDGVTTLVIDVYNRSHDPLHLQRVGLRGGNLRLVCFQSPGLPNLPVKLEPTDGYVMVSKVDSFADALAKSGVSAAGIKGPYCTDGAGKEYGRRLRRDERRALSEAFEALTASQAASTPDEQPGQS